MNDAISSLWQPTAPKHRPLIWGSIRAPLTTQIRHVTISCQNKAGMKWLTFVSSCQSGRLHPVIQRSPGARPHPVARTSSPDQQRELSVRRLMAQCLSGKSESLLRYLPRWQVGSAWIDPGRAEKLQSPSLAGFGGVDRSLQNIPADSSRGSLLRQLHLIQKWGGPAEVHRSGRPIHLIWTSWNVPLGTLRGFFLSPPLTGLRSLQLHPHDPAV